LRAFLGGLNDLLGLAIGVVIAEPPAFGCYLSFLFFAGQTRTFSGLVTAPPFTDLLLNGPSDMDSFLGGEILANLVLVVLAIYNVVENPPRAVPPNQSESPGARWCA
jgi:hypothetical protein